MNIFPQMMADLRAHQAACRELLVLAERESQALRQGQTNLLADIHRSRKLLLPQLSNLLEKVRQHRVLWQALTAPERAAQPEIGFLVRQAQDLILRVLLLDRENEQGLLRRGLVPPREMAAVPQRQPHFVADLYRRRSRGNQ
jgi:hypothetical protein